MKAPSNTAREANDNPLAALFNALPGGIEAQEARGQRELVNSDTLPVDCRDKSAFERMGIKFGDPVPGDSLFVYVELPNGWSKKGTDHSMWSKLVDDKGRERASIFYKAAFYDRKARMHAERRFGYTANYERLNEGFASARVTDCGKVIFATDEVSVDPLSRDRYKVTDAHEAVAREWLEKHYPDWLNASAYWD
jgi:hypothetical protein